MRLVQWSGYDSVTNSLTTVSASQMLINPALNYTKCNFRAIPWTQMTRLDDKKLDKITEPHMQNGLNNSVESTVNYIDWIN